MGLFSGHKDKNEERQTTEIKQAAISDSALNSINSADNVKEEKEFVNPFANNTQTNQDSPQNNLQDNMSFNSVPQTINQTPQMQNNAPDFGFDVNSSQNNQPPQSNNFSQQTSSNQQFNSIEQSMTPKDESLTEEHIKEIIDETVEKILEEKWESITNNINQVLKWKEKKEEEINMLKEDIVTISESFSKLESKLINKISNYDKNILDVNSEIKALEKVFQKITPTLINNVNQLSKIADDLKEVKNKKEE